jgi:hypothetical protein
VGFTAGLTALVGEKRERGQGRDMFMSEGERKLVCRAGGSNLNKDEFGHDLTLY